MRDVELLQFVLGQRLSQVVLKNLHLPLSPKIVHQQKAASQQILPQPLDLFVVQLHVSDLAHICEGILEQIRIGKAEDVFVFVEHYVQLRKLAEDLRKVKPGLRVIVRPRHARRISEALTRIQRRQLPSRKLEPVRLVFLLSQPVILVSKPLSVLSVRREDKPAACRKTNATNDQYSSHLSLPS